MARHARSRIHLPEAELGWRFSRSSGPGGQSVNTTDSRVELLWVPAESTVLDDRQRALVIARLRGRMVGDTVVIASSEYKSQHRNREAAKARLEELVTQALVVAKSRRATKPSRASQQRRLDAKRQRSRLKQGRQQRPE